MLSAQSMSKSSCRRQIAVFVGIAQKQKFSIYSCFNKLLVCHLIQYYACKIEREVLNAIHKLAIDGSLFMLRLTVKTLGICFIGCTLLLSAASHVMAAEWQVDNISSGNKNLCIITSAKMPVDDGYQKVNAQIVVDSNTIIVKTESELDPAFSDIGMKIGNRDFIPVDKVKLQKQADFELHYAKIIQQFKEGREVTVQLRFWPTWPVTGTHSVSFSLIGFTKAYDEAAKCK